MLHKLTVLNGDTANVSEPFSELSLAVNTSVENNTLALVIWLGIKDHRFACELKKILTYRTNFTLFQFQSMYENTDPEQQEVC